MGKKLNRHIFCKAMMLERIVIHCNKNKFKKERNLEREISLFNFIVVNSLSGSDVL